MERLFYDMSHSQFHGTIINLNEDLGCEKIVEILFLCRDHYSSDQSRLKEPIDLFQQLLDKGLITRKKFGLLVEIIWRIGRKDLVKKYLVRDVNAYEEHARRSSLFTPYRLMLHELCEQMLEKSMKLLVRLLEMKGATRNALSGLTQPQHLFLFMEQQNLLSPENQGQLIDMINETKDEYLYEVLVRYEKAPPKTRSPPRYKHPAHDCPTQHNGLSPQPNPFTYMHQDMDVLQANRGVANMQINENDGPQLDRYPMRSSPRGLCVIISNTDFHKGQEIYGAKRMNDREGGDKDLEILKKTWQNLDFSVQVYRNLTGVQMQRTMYHMGAETDHSQYDAFVCCILTHGNFNTVYGCDGAPMEMKELVNPVKPSLCKSLTEKPKLFFIQACQGGDRQQGYHGDIETDSPASMDSAHIQTESPYVPNEADILMSYATVPGFVSYRSKSSGSFYVKALCECLDKYAPKYDLMSVLTAVNKIVSEKTVTRDDGWFKQVPQPQMTLRKLLYLN